LANPDITDFEPVKLEEKNINAMDDEETHFSWPSDTHRYKALASSAELTLKQTRA